MNPVLFRALQERPHSGQDHPLCGLSYLFLQMSKSLRNPGLLPGNENRIPEPAETRSSGLVGFDGCLIFFRLTAYGANTVRKPVSDCLGKGIPIPDAAFGARVGGIASHRTSGCGNTGSIAVIAAVLDPPIGNPVPETVPAGLHGLGGGGLAGIGFAAFGADTILIVVAQSGNLLQSGMYPVVAAGVELRTYGFTAGLCLHDTLVQLAGIALPVNTVTGGSTGGIVGSILG